MFADDLPFGDDDDMLGIDPYADRTIGEGRGHAIAIALQMDQGIVGETRLAYSTNPASEWSCPALMDGLGASGRVCLGHHVSFRIRWGKDTPRAEWRRGRVVEAFDELEDGHPRLAVRSEAAPIDQLAFEGGEETLAHRIVVRVADRARRRTNAGFLAAIAESDRRVLGIFKRSSQHDLCWLIGETGQAPLRVFSNSSVFRGRELRKCGGHGCNLVGAVHAEIGPFGEVLAQQSVSVLRWCPVATGCRIAEIDLASPASILRRACWAISAP